MVNPTATYSVPTGASKFFRAEHGVHKVREGCDAKHDRQESHDVPPELRCGHRASRMRAWPQSWRAQGPPFRSSTWEAPGIELVQPHGSCTQNRNGHLRAGQEVPQESLNPNGRCSG